MANTLRESFVKKNRLITKKLENEFIVVDTENGQVHSLNETAAMIWQMYDGKLSIDEITQCILEKYKVTFETAKSDVEKVLRSFIEKGLINHPAKNA